MTSHSQFTVSTKRAYFTAFWQGMLGLILMFVDVEEFLHGHETIPNLAIGLVGFVFLTFGAKALLAALFPSVISINRYGIVWDGHTYLWANIFYYDGYQLHDAAQKTHYLRLIRIYLADEYLLEDGEAFVLTRLWDFFYRKHRRTFDVSHFGASNEDILASMHYYYHRAKG